MEIKTTGQIMGSNIKVSEDIGTFYKKKWVAVDDMVKQIEHLKERIALKCGDWIYTIIDDTFKELTQSQSSQQVCTNCNGGGELHGLICSTCKGIGKLTHSKKMGGK